MFCKAPPLPVVSVLSHSQIEVSYNHWNNADTGLMEKVYLFIKKSTDTTWKYASKYMAPNYQKPNSVFGYLTAYANYTIRLVDGGYEGFSLATNLVHARTLEHGGWLHWGNSISSKNHIPYSVGNKKGKTWGKKEWRRTGGEGRTLTQDNRPRYSDGKLGYNNKRQICCCDTNS